MESRVSGNWADTAAAMSLVSFIIQPSMPGSNPTVKKEAAFGSLFTYCFSKLRFPERYCCGSGRP
jgi:hypothetical protein